MGNCQVLRFRETSLRCLGAYSNISVDRIFKVECMLSFDQNCESLMLNFKPVKLDSDFSAICYLKRLDFDLSNDTPNVCVVFSLHCCCYM